ncbi:hypothetical protein U9M48_034870, partial [Paspalum notatum var. saurae]
MPGHRGRGEEPRMTGAGRCGLRERMGRRLAAVACYCMGANFKEDPFSCRDFRYYGKASRFRDVAANFIPESKPRVVIFSLVAIIPDSGIQPTLNAGREINARTTIGDADLSSEHCQVNFRGRGTSSIDGSVLAGLLFGDNLVKLKRWIPAFLFSHVSHYA